MLFDDDLSVQGPGMQMGMRDGRRGPDDFRRFPRRYPHRPFIPVPIVIGPGYRPCYTYDRYGRCCDRFGRCYSIYDDYYYPVMAPYDDMDDYE